MDDDQRTVSVINNSIAKNKFSNTLKPGFHYYATNARNAVDADASDENARNERKQRTPRTHHKKKQRTHRTRDALPPLSFVF